jgi:lipid-A-disaccharide synthase
MKKILMIAGEASGDIYGSDLARHLYKLIPSLKIAGIGGKRMRDAGVNILYDMSGISVVGVSEILPRLKAIRQAYKLAAELIRAREVDIVVLIDYPGFNIRLAGAAKKAGIPVVYYVSPQIWAWRVGRIRLLAKRIKKMIVVLPFEEDIYKRAGIDCSFIGHPLVDEILSTRPLEESLLRYGIGSDKTVIGLFPGSRIGEIRALLPAFLEAAQLIKNGNPKIQLVMAVAESLNFKEVEDVINKWDMSKNGENRHLDVKTIRGEANDVLNVSNVIIAASGTITLQAALLEKPMVIVYRLSQFTYLIAKLLVNVKDIGLVNILAGRRIVPELLQSNATPDKIAAEAKRFLYDSKYYDRTKKDLNEIKLKLGPPGASARVAKVIAGMLN